MSSEKRDKLARVEYLPPAESETVAYRIETHAVSLRQTLAARFGRASLKSTIETTKVMTELATVTEVFERTVDRLKDLENIKSLDRKMTQEKLREQEHKLREQDYKSGQIENKMLTLSHEREEAESDHQVRLLEKDVRKAELLAKLEAPLFSDGTPNKEKRSHIDNLRSAIARDTEVDRARLQVIAEEQRECLAKVKRGEMTQDEMDHYMAIVRECVAQYGARKK